MQTHSFSVEFAQAFGLNAAIILNDLLFWINHNRDNPKCQHDGQVWTYQKYQDIQKRHPYFSIDQVNRTLKKLKDCGVLISEKLDPNPFNHVRWYTVDRQVLNTILSNNFTDTAISPKQESDAANSEKAQSPNLSSNKDTKNIEQAGEPARESISEKSELIEKKEALEAIPSLTQEQIMQLARNHKLEDIQKAVELAKREKKIESPYKWLSKCMREKFWVTADPEETKQYALFNSFKSSLEAFRRENRANLYLDTQGATFLVQGPNMGGLELTLNDFKNQERVKAILEVINNSFSKTHKLVFVKVNGQNAKIEVMR